MKKILQIGVGGIGSFLAENVFDVIDNGIIPEPIELTLADGDIVEADQRIYQNFDLDGVGMNKAEVIGKTYGFKYIKKAITDYRQLRGYDLIVLCVDNESTRELVVKYCHNNKIEFLDIRATGRKVFVMPKLKTLQENLKFIDSKDLNSYSCQDAEDLKKGWYQLGNKVAGMIGTQMIVNCLRGHNNHIHNLII